MYIYFIVILNAFIANNIDTEQIALSTHIRLLHLEQCDIG